MSSAAAELGRDRVGLYAGLRRDGEAYDGALVAVDSLPGSPGGVIGEQANPAATGLPPDLAAAGRIIRAREVAP